MFGYIYKTTNLLNGKIYIGKKTSSYFRNSYLGSGKLIKKAVDKYGEEEFEVIMLCECLTEDELNAREIELIRLYDSTCHKIGYNISLGGSTPMSGMKHTQETREKMSRSRMGHVSYTKGMKMPVEVGRKISARLKGRLTTETHRKNLSHAGMGHIGWNKGGTRTEEEKRKMSAAKMGHPVSDETRHRISEANKRYYESRKAI